MRELSCDVAVIGAGTAGIAAHRAALDAGAASILIEQGPGGTTCARVGCMPSKLLIVAANAAHEARAAHRFGIHVEHVRVDGRDVMRRVRQQRDCFVDSVFEGLEKLPEGSRITGRAVFEDATTLRIDDAIRLRFKAAVIATGSSPSVPKPLEGLGERLLTTDTLFEIEDLPESIAVLGGGPVGIELAQALARLGVKTALFDPAGALGGIADPDLAEAARDIFGKDIALHLGATVERAEATEGGVTLHWSDKDGGKGSASFARVLAATGRPPNVRGIGLASTGLSLDEDGMPAFDPHSLVCEGDSILIAGDANAARPVLHEASRQGRIAGRNAAVLARSDKGSIENPRPWVKLAMVFTEPQIAAIGDLGGDLVGKVDFCDQGRAQVMGRNQGGMRVYADRSGRLLGAEMLGPDVEHLAHILSFAIQDGHTAQDLLDRPFYHLTLEEGLRTALSDIIRKTAG
ncbi:dihydrolipoyl dehydrogenase [Methylobacterium thuringiense]|uniref:Dihydrolipoyl dehydrogenase n=1 Tax=Methylobacterium thuringiense TaxID=1003091 RepID=A0ABQ4TII8_9HYPH|nr:dihydrolipoyl dehydrogenase [Methylobacterium thuringiense]GJE53835.1 Dihydrolipoyl dehydrogenase [Methylobacterium thuringiense]